MIKEILKEAECCLLEAMLESDSFGTSKENSSTYQKGKFRVEDCPKVSFLGKKEGMTTIWFDEKIIWFMNYAETYREEDRPLLRRILRITYRQGLFNGGRGLKKIALPASGRVYVNNVFEESDFEHFSGIEILSDASGPRGCCNYWGTTMI